MTLVTQATFARMCKKSRKSVTEWKQAGKLVLHGEAVDVEATEARMKTYRRGGSPVVLSVEEAAVLSEPEGNKGNTGGNKGNTKGNSVRVTPAPVLLGDDETIEQGAERLVASGFEDLTLDEALRRKENYLALLRRLEYEQKSGSLVDLDTASGILFEEFRSQRDAWLNWPSRVGPLVAVDLGIDDASRVTEVLEAYVHKQLQQLGDPQADFTDGKA